MKPAIALLLIAGAVHAADITKSVDLTAPGALEALRIERPEHYAKVDAILSYVESHPFVPTAPKAIEARFDAADVQMLQWKVSYPPKLHVSFTLDATRYSADVVPALAPARAMPAR